MPRIVQDTGDIIQIVETISPEYFYVLEGKRSTDEWDYAYIAANGLGVLAYPYMYRKGFWTSSSEGPPGVSAWMIFEVPPCGVTSLSNPSIDTSAQRIIWSQSNGSNFFATILRHVTKSIQFSTDSSGCGLHSLANIIEYRFGVPSVLGPS